MKEGKLRMCTNFRALKKQTKLDAYPLSRIDDILDRLNVARWFRKIDLSTAYHWVPIHPEHKEQMALITQYRLFKFLVLPFGLVSALETF